MRLLNAQKRTILWLTSDQICLENVSAHMPALAATPALSSGRRWTSSSAAVVQSRLCMQWLCMHCLLTSGHSFGILSWAASNSFATMYLLSVIKNGKGCLMCLYIARIVKKI